MTASTDLDDTLAAIRARAEAATPGPWEAFDANEGDGNYRPGWMVANDAFHNPPADPDAPWIAVELHVGIRADAEFIAHARTDVPRLLDLLDEMRAERDAARQHHTAEYRDRRAAEAALARVRDFADAQIDEFGQPYPWRAHLLAQLGGADTTTTDGSEA